MRQLDQLERLAADDERDLQIANLRYALRCHIPAMKRHVHIHTGYGAVDFRGPQARKVTALCEELLESKTGPGSLISGQQRIEAALVPFCCVRQLTQASS